MATYMVVTFCAGNDGLPCHPNLILLRRSHDASIFISDPKEVQVLKTFTPLFCNHSKCPWIFCTKLRYEEKERLTFLMSYVLKRIQMGLFEIKERSNFTRVPRIMHRVLKTFNNPGSMYTLDFNRAMYDSALLSKLILCTLSNSRPISCALRQTCINILTPAQLHDLIYKNCPLDLIIPSMKTLSLGHSTCCSSDTPAPLHSFSHRHPPK